MSDWREGLHIYVVRRISSFTIGGPFNIHLNVVTFICSLLVGGLQGGVAMFWNSL